MILPRISVGNYMYVLVVLLSRYMTLHNAILPNIVLPH